MPTEIYADCEGSGDSTRESDYRLGNDPNYVVMNCPQIRGEAGRCRGLTIADDTIHIDSVYVTAVALMLLHAGLPVGQYLGSGKLQCPTGEIDLANYRLDSVEFKPLYTVPFVLRKVSMTKSR